MEYRFKIRFGDTDAAGIVYYPNFYRWMDEATHEFFQSLGYPTDQLMSKKLATPLVEANCVFKSPGLFNREIVLTTKVEMIREKVFKLIHHFKDGETVLAEGYEVRAWVSLESGKPKAQPIPEDVKKKMEQYLIGGN
ncbi:acyl-CoA thioesterase [Savagea faecisuis]|uniref:Acyl-CoA thioesterase n=1 Tax=Savagea faecisuis TaxID=1274803 RepID=A0ABW3GZA6_9BACL